MCIGIAENNEDFRKWLANRDVCPRTEVLVLSQHRWSQWSKTRTERNGIYILHPRTTVSQDVQTRFPMQFAKFLSKIKGIFNTVPVSWIQHSLRNFPLF